MNAKILARRLQEGDRAALARAITVAEEDSPEGDSLIRSLAPGGSAFVLGVTGPQGTGKSTIVSRLVAAYRKNGLKVGVLAVDPSSPLTGGALLGDRIRMSEHLSDPNVYIRSMATRGWTGGLSRSASRAIQLMDAAGFDMIVVETVGIGQTEVEVVAVSNAVLVVLMPGQGDEVQASKAGLMEIGDILVVNKSDLEGAGQMASTLISVAKTQSRTPEVVLVSARTGAGMERLTSEIDSLRAKFESGDHAMKLRRVKGMLVQTAKGVLSDRLEARTRVRAEKLAEQVIAGKLSLEDASMKLLD